MANNLTQTLIRVGRFDLSLEEAVKKYSERLLPVTMGLGNTIKYATFKECTEPYLLMVSQQKDKLVSSSGYNVILSVTSYSDEKNKNVADQFERETNMELNLQVSEFLRKNSVIMGMSFSVFEKNPKMAMAVLSGM